MTWREALPLVFYAVLGGLGVGLVVAYGGRLFLSSGWALLAGVVVSGAWVVFWVNRWAARPKPVEVEDEEEVTDA